MIIIVIIKILFDWTYHYLSGVYPGIMYSVNWSVAYYFIEYMFISTILLHIFFLVEQKKIQPKWLLKGKTVLKFFFFIGSLSYWLMGWVQLWFINSSVEVWQDGLFTNGIYWTHVASAICGLITFMATYEYKRRYPKYSWI